MGGQSLAVGSRPTGQGNERGRDGGNGDNRAESVQGVSPAGSCRPFLLGDGNPGWLVQVAVEALQGSGWFLNLGCAVEQAEQAGRREFGEISAKRFAWMEPIGGKLAFQPDAQVSSLEREGEVLVIGQHLNAAEEISKEPQCFQILERRPSVAEISQVYVVFVELETQRCRHFSWPCFIYQASISSCLKDREL